MLTRPLPRSCFAAKSATNCPNWRFISCISWTRVDSTSNCRDVEDFETLLSPWELNWLSIRWRFWSWIAWESTDSLSSCRFWWCWWCPALEPMTNQMITSCTIDRGHSHLVSGHWVSSGPMQVVSWRETSTWLNLWTAAFNTGDRADMPKIIPLWLNGINQGIQETYLQVLMGWVHFPSVPLQNCSRNECLTCTYCGPAAF